jgi:hypothetical protein
MCVRGKKGDKNFRAFTYFSIYSKMKWKQYTGLSKSRFTVVRMEKDMQVMIITIALLTQKNVTMAQCT